MDRIQRKVKELKESKSPKDVVDGQMLDDFGLTAITLRPYQVAGVNWLIQCYHDNHGCILGDEMGLGKTCQAISFLVYLAGSKTSSGPHLIMCPLSVMPNWKDELHRFAPHLSVVIYMGDKDARAELRGDIKDNIRNINVIITTYEICLKDEAFLRTYSFNTLIVDEAHRLKNRDSCLHLALLEFDIRHSILLTGTPVQNNLHELYSLLTFVAPKIFKYRYVEEFIDKYRNVDKNQEDVSELHEILQPFIIRRVKSQVIKDLPQRSEVVLYHGMSALQKKLYKAILTKDLEVFENSANKTRLMNILMQLRKCVNHPYLFDGVEPEPFQLGEHLVESSGKLFLIDQLLRYCHKHNHKVLMFSQMTRMLDVLQDYLGYRGYSYERLDGSVRGEERYLAIQKFNQDEDVFIFLLSTKAGGVGLNLVSADTVIFVDSDFNPQNDLQAAARAHRIGQTRPVKIIRLIGGNTVEEVILKRAESKLKLTNTVLEGGQFSLGGAASQDQLIADSNIQLQDILKFGVEKMFENEDSTIESVDFQAILGATAGGGWHVEAADQSKQTSLTVQPMDISEVREEATPSTSSMYIFEGKDYSKEASVGDRKTIDEIIAAQHKVMEDTNAENRALRKTKVTCLAAGLLLPSRKPRAKLTPEQLEERRKKRAENAARRAKEEEEEEERQRERAQQKKLQWWTKNGYKSTNLPLDSGGESNEESEEEDEMEDERVGRGRRQIRYVVGDVTAPSNTGNTDAYIVHCVDDSGHWGSGGLFTALHKKSTQPEEQYERAGEFDDLQLGFTHLIPMTDASVQEEKCTGGKHYVALIVAQHRDRRNNLSGIKLDSLTEGFKRLYRQAHKHKASVHLPRIGHNTKGFNWYGTEKLIYKHLASRGVPTYIYYYPRKGTRKRKFANQQQQNSSHADVKRQASSSPQPSSSAISGDLPVNISATPDDSSLRSPSPIHKNNNDSPPGSSLSGVLEGVCIHFYMVPSETKKKLTRYLMSLDGDLHVTLEDSTTHIVVEPDISEEDKQSLKEVLDGTFPDALVVTTDWLKESIINKCKLSPSKYLITLP